MNFANQLLLMLAATLNEEAILRLLKESIEEHELVPSDTNRNAVTNASMLWTVKQMIIHEMKQKSLTQEQAIEKITRDTNASVQGKKFFDVGNN